jgi:hypothetical protein
MVFFLEIFDTIIKLNDENIMILFDNKGDTSDKEMHKVKNLIYTY